LKTFVNTVLGEVWEDEYASKIGAEALAERASQEDYEHLVVPSQVLALTIGCDVQDDRLSLSVWGWGRDEEAWLIDRSKLYGDPARAEVWQQLDEVMAKPFLTEDGVDMKISICAIDSGGHHTAEVYSYARERMANGVIAIKGMSTKGKPPLGKPSKVDLNRKGQVVKKGAQVFPVGSDTVKSLLFGRLKHNEKGAGYLHFYPTVGTEYFEELTAEKQVLRYKNGYPQRVWMKKSSARNEALDELVYAYSALHRLYQLYDRRTIWDQFERAVRPIEGEPVIAPARKSRKAFNVLG
jgi:phage terminase large subunit GpA-like protein